MNLYLIQGIDPDVDVYDAEAPEVSNLAFFVRGDSPRDAAQRFLDQYRDGTHSRYEDRDLKEWDFDVVRVPEELTTGIAEAYIFKKKEYVTIPIKELKFK